MASFPSTVTIILSVFVAILVIVVIVMIVGFVLMIQKYCKKVSVFSTLSDRFM